MLSRRQALKSLTAAALAAVAPIPAMGAETGLIALPADKAKFNTYLGVDRMTGVGKVLVDGNVAVLDCPVWKLKGTKFERTGNYAGRITCYWTNVGE